MSILDNFCYVAAWGGVPRPLDRLFLRLSRVERELIRALCVLSFLCVLCERYFYRPRRLDRPLEAGHVHLFAEHLGELLDLGQLGEISQAEVQQELLGGAVEHGPADHGLAAGDADEALLQQRLEHAPRLHRSEEHTSEL